MNPIAINVEAGKTYWWCRCGRSGQQPFCDGAHKGSNSSPLKYMAAESGQVWFCVCKKTASPPFCDGSHKALATSTDS
jgi:CDGSH-type Zn-finger protein